MHSGHEKFHVAAMLVCVVAWTCTTPKFRVSSGVDVAMCMLRQKANRVWMWMFFDSWQSRAHSQNINIPAQEFRAADARAHQFFFHSFRCFVLSINKVVATIFRNFSADLWRGFKTNRSKCLHWTTVGRAFCTHLQNSIKSCNFGPTTAGPRTRFIVFNFFE